jgi:hypothetical protein
MTASAIAQAPYRASWSRYSPLFSYKINREKLLQDPGFGVNDNERTPKFTLADAMHT